MANGEASHVAGCFVPRPLLFRATLVPQLLSRLEEHDARGPRSAPRPPLRFGVAALRHLPDAFRVINTDQNLSGMMFDVFQEDAGHSSDLDQKRSGIQQKRR